MKNYSDKCISRGKIIVIHVLAGILMAFIFGLIFGYFVMLLWNSLMPDIFALKEVTYWQGVGLVIMFRLLLGSHGYHKQGQQARKYHGYKESPAHNCNSGNNEYYLDWWEKEGKEIFRQYVDKNKPR